MAAFQNLSACSLAVSTASRAIGRMHAINEATGCWWLHSVCKHGLLGLVAAYMQVVLGVFLLMWDHSVGHGATHTGAVH